MKEKYPSKDILNISLSYGATYFTVSLLILPATVAPPAPYGDGRGLCLYNPKTKSLITTHHETPASSLGFSITYTFINYILD